MRAVVDGFGKFIGKEGNLIVIKGRSSKRKLNPSELKQIIVIGKAGISSDAIELLMKNSVDVVFLSKGEITARLSHPSLGMAKTRREQYYAYHDRRSVELSKEFVIAKLRNQMAILSNLAKSRKGDVGDYLMEKRKEIENVIHQLSKLNGERIDDVRQEILGLEGKASNHYWDSLRLIFPKEYNFDGRKGIDEKHSRYARDIINAMLNYGYAILHSECIRAVELAGLDIYAGFLHSDRSGRTSLPLDLMEEFRQQIVDKAVIKLIGYKQIKPDDCRIENFICRLEDKARKTLLKEVLERLDSKTQYAGRNVTFSSIINSQARKIARFIRGEVRYKGFWQRW
ncbi:CRISPR-associated endonuclease Cas1 [Archaeoglobales archaeon]|nr:MAG: CRISPR-associated endonuclease Cas1 [Archaeoglobales archaeon]